MEMINIYEHTAMARDFYGMEYDFKVMGNGNGNGIRTIWDTRTYEDLDPLYTSPLGLKTLSPGGGPGQFNVIK
ncbi:hypothetical protein N7504_004413 [Penicillium tannophilum]|nr:hypothetical protein N7504_004413 [Penicillium tannophilum]